MNVEIKRILIVDDVPDDILITKIILEKESCFKVVEANNWKEALAEIKKGDISLVLLDLKMPEMDGLELLGIIRHENSAKELPVIIYSSAPNSGDDYRFYGSDGYIKKYGDPTALINKVKKALKC